MVFKNLSLSKSLCSNIDTDHPDPRPAILVLAPRVCVDYSVRVYILQSRCRARFLVLSPPLCRDMGPTRDDTSSFSRYMAPEHLDWARSSCIWVSRDVYRACVERSWARYKYLVRTLQLLASFHHLHWTPISILISLTLHTIFLIIHYLQSSYTVFSLQHHRHSASSQPSITSTSQQCPISSARRRVRLMLPRSQMRSVINRARTQTP